MLLRREAETQHQGKYVHQVMLPRTLQRPSTVKGQEGKWGHKGNAVAATADPITSKSHLGPPSNFCSTQHALPPSTEDPGSRRLRTTPEFV